MVDSLSSVAASSAASAPSASQASAASLADDFTTFLTLLTTQLQNQDPLDPLDSNEFTNQLVNFTGVEQQIQTNSNLESLLDIVGQDNLNGLAGLLGQEGLVEGNVGTHEGNGVRFEVDFAEAPDAVQFQVRDAGGQIVFQGPGQLISGTQEFIWDGTDGLGNVLPNGIYSLTVNASRDGAALGSQTFVQDEISSIDTSTDTPILTVGAQIVTQDELLRLVAGGARL